LKAFIESYYQQVFGSVVRLARLTDEREADALTQEILTALYNKREQLEAESRKGVFVYKVVLAHVFAHLRARGEEEKLAFLRKILLIDPGNLPLLDDSGDLSQKFLHDKAGSDPGGHL
jgi:DNA-directed RNA polymerase specialized sigma24 family protein